MITGSVSSHFDPMVKVVLHAMDRSDVEIEVTVDSGFNGGLTLPQSLLDQLGWPYLSSEIVVLANDGEYSMETYRGLINWKGRQKFVTAFVSDSKPLLGTGFLEGKELWIEFRRGGDVIISDPSTEFLPKPHTPVKRLIGLVGGIGSGKSLVAAAFASHGGFVIAADAFGHEALEQPEILARIIERWKNRVLDEHGKVDRKKMGAIVFASPVERANLEMLVFPWIERRIQAEIAKAQADPRIQFIVLDAAIMLEAGWNNVCSKIVYVHAPRTARLERLTTQRGWTADDLARRESAQLPLAIKASRADAAVDNSGSVENTRKQVDALLGSWHIL